MLAERLEKARTARHVIVRAPVGSGVTGTLTPVIQQAAASGLVLIISPARVILDQWMDLLRSVGTTTNLLTSDLALELASSLTVRRTEVLLSTPARIRQGPVKAWLSSAQRL